MPDAPASDPEGPEPDEPATDPPGDDPGGQGPHDRPQFAEDEGAREEGAREETVAAGFAGLQKGIDELVRLTRRADEHVGELHAENQRLRAGELASVTLPLLRDVVRLHDEVAQLASACHPEARTDLDLVRSRLLDTLARWGLAPFAPEVGEALDATRHHGVGRVPSSDGEPGTIATVRRPGFTHDDGRTFRAAEVEVFQTPPTLAPPEPAAPEPPPTRTGDDSGGQGPHDRPQFAEITETDEET